MEEDEMVLSRANNKALKFDIDEARSQAAAGQTIPLREVANWLDSWGTPNERPAPSPRQTARQPPLFHTSLTADRRS